jgi:uncharacterized protein (TIGR03545 family)
MKMIRWSGLLAFVLIVGLMGIFTLFFLDGIIKGIIEDQASRIIGSQVNIGRLKLNLFSLKIDIRNIQIANPDDPMHNALEVGELTCDLVAMPLLKRKAVIQRMAVLDLALNTPRQTSGTLPPELGKEREDHTRPLDVGIEAPKKLKDCTLPDFSILNEVKRGVTQSFLDKAALPSSTFLEAYHRKISEVRTSWDQRLTDLPTPQEIKAQILSLRDLRDRPVREASQLPGYLKSVKAQQKKLADARESLTEAQKILQKEIEALRHFLNQGRDLKDRDFNALGSQLDLAPPSVEDLLCVLLGKEAALKVSRVIGWYETLSRFMHGGASPGESQEPVVAETLRFRGAAVRFPVTGGYPKFLLEVAEFSVRPDGRKASERLAFAELAGELQGLTSHPVLYGKPTLFRLEGALTGELACGVGFSGEFDHRRTPHDDHIDLMIKDFKLEGTGKNTSGQLPLFLRSAFLDVNARLRIKDEGLEGQALVRIRQPSVDVGSEAMVLADFFNNLEAFDMNLSIGGTLRQPSMALTFPATKTLSPILQDTFQAQLKEIRKILKRAIDARIDQEMLAAKEEADALERRILDDLSRRIDLAEMAPAGSNDPRTIQRLKETLPF